MNRLAQIENVERTRTVEQIVKGTPTSDGAGVKLTRVLGQQLQRRLDPFLMLDAFGSDNPDDYIAGFPDHPHRGFETVTYMLAGRMRHRDSAGHEGLLQTGGVQWMMAGQGVIHSEIPEQQDGVMEGFQLWLNLPSRSKMTPAWYRDIPGERIPQYATADGATVRVIAGSSNGVAGAMQREDTEPLYLDISLPANGSFAARIPASHNAFAFVYRGSARLGGKPLASGSMGILSNDAGADGVQISSEQGAKLILVAGKPINEPIAQYGPFVMNTQQEIFQAISDFREGRFAQAQ
ncbi:MAG TPA: pirin family protein [Gallionellaceae bacterium]